MIQKFFDKKITINYDLQQKVDELTELGNSVISTTTNDTTGISTITYSDGEYTLTKELKPTITYVPIDINKIPSESLRGVATRIPGEGKHSMITYEVVGSHHIIIHKLLHRMT